MKVSVSASRRQFSTRGVTDYSNQSLFLTDVQGLLSKQPNTATVGLIWWWGRKEGAW